MARAALRWSAADLAKAANLGYATVARFESGQVVAVESVSVMRVALEAAGVEFIAAGSIVRAGKGSAGAGVRLRSSNG
jgi:transcriptional regulator with XRE-family HTH domain